MHNAHEWWMVKLHYAPIRARKRPEQIRPGKVGQLGIPQPIVLPGNEVIDAHRETSRGSISHRLNRALPQPQEMTYVQESPPTFLHGWESSWRTTTSVIPSGLNRLANPSKTPLSKAQQ